VNWVEEKGRKKKRVDRRYSKISIELALNINRISPLPEKENKNKKIIKIR